MSAPILHLSVSQRPVFLLNSRLSLFSVTNSRWLPFSLSYGVILPSSLTTLLPSVFGFSPRLPVSVCGTGTNNFIAAFLDSVDSETSLLLFAPFNTSPYCTWFASYTQLCASPSISFPRFSYPPVSPHFLLLVVLESTPVVHRLRLSTSP